MIHAPRIVLVRVPESRIVHDASVGFFGHRTSGKSRSRCGRVGYPRTNANPHVGPVLKDGDVREVLPHRCGNKVTNTARSDHRSVGDIAVDQCGLDRSIMGARRFIRFEVQATIGDSDFAGARGVGCGQVPNVAGSPEAFRNRTVEPWPDVEHNRR